MLVAAGGIVAIACGSFGSDAEPELPATAVDAGGDGGVPPTPSDDGSAPVDAGVGPSGFDLTYRPACPRPAVPPGSCVGVGNCTRTEIFHPAVAEHPWGIAVDARHVFWLAFPAGTDGYNGNGAAVLRRLDRATKEVVEIARDQIDAKTLYANGPYLYWAATAGTQTELRVMRKDVAPCSAAGCPGSMKNVPFDGIAPVAQMAMPAEGALFVMQENGAVKRFGPMSVSLDTVAVMSGPGALVAGVGEVFATGAKQTAVVRILASGASARTFGSLEPRGSGAPFVGATFLATDCTTVFAFASDRTVDRLPIAADGGTFGSFVALPPIDVFAVASDAKFLYVGAANGGGLHAIDTAAQPTRVKVADGNVWRLDVADDVIAYGEHGTDGSANGAIFLIEK